MPFDPHSHRASMLRHYTRLGNSPGWTQYVSHQLKQMERDEPFLYAGIHSQVNQAIKDLQTQDSQPPSLPTSDPAGQPS